MPDLAGSRIVLASLTDNEPKYELICQNIEITTCKNKYDLQMLCGWIHFIV